ncbi:MAG TPA: DUF5615 family PIN-like protein [Longimicrobium sp.]
MKRVLLDENLPHRLRRELPECEVLTVAQAGWAGTKNGALLRLATQTFDVFLTADRSIPHQQVLATFELGFVLLEIGGTRLKDILPFIEQVREAVAAVRSGELIRVPADSAG